MMEFTKGFLPSEWFSLICLLVLAVGAVGLIVVGTIIRVKTAVAKKRGEEWQANKTLGTLCSVMLIIMGLAFIYFATLCFTRMSPIVAIIVYGICSQTKIGKRNFFSCLVMTVVVSMLIFAPVFGVLTWDNNVKARIRQEEQIKTNEMAQTIASTEVAEGVTFNDVILSYEGVNETEWSANYYEYNDSWSITAYGKYKPDDSYSRDIVIEVKFIYTEKDGFNVEQVQKYELGTRDYTTYSKAESKEIFANMMKEALK